MAASIAPCGARGTKKRKVSSTKDSEDSKTEAPGSEQQPDIKDKASVHFDTGQKCGLIIKKIKIQTSVYFIRFSNGHSFWSLMCCYWYFSLSLSRESIKSG